MATNSNITDVIKPPVSAPTFSQTIKDILEKYSNDNVEKPFDGTLNLEKKTVETLSDDELEKKAKASLQEYMIDEKNSITSKANTAITNAHALMDDLRESAADTQKNIDLSYSNAKDNASNEALRRGLARSSIIVEQLSKLDTEQAKAATAVYEKLNSDITKANEQIRTLEAERQSSLKDLDLKYASKLTLQIEKLKEEQRKHYDEVLEYNNQIEQKIQQAKNSAIMDNLDYEKKLYDTQDARYEISKKNEELMENELYEAYVNDLSKLSRSAALARLNNASYTEPLKEVTIRQLKAYAERLKN